MRVHVAVLTILFVAFSGCVASEDPEPEGCPDTAACVSTAPPPTVGADTGSVRGLVMDDQQVPVAGVQILIREPEQVVQTDASGAYTFNELVPATYSIFAQKVGYEQVGQKVDVAAGEIMWRNFTLTPLSTIVPYVDIVPKVGFIDVGQFQADITVLKALNQTCKQCKWPFVLEDNTMMMMTEYTYQFATPCPAPAPYNKMGWHAYRNYTGDNPFANNAQNGGFINAGYLGDHEGVRFGKSVVKRPTDQITWYLTSSACPNYQQKVEIWFSFGHHEELPDDWTAAPPK